MINKILVLLFLTLIPGVAANKECTVDKNIIYSILLNEGLTNRAGYEYIISFNNKDEAKSVKEIVAIKPFFINNRTLDCRNKELCSYILYQLSKANITNLDLGAFQINYKIHNLKTLNDYFNIDKSYKFACSHIESCIKQYGNSWYSYACYHSRTPKYNKIYREKLKINYEKVQELLAKN
jgi:hypothetical protein